MANKEDYVEVRAGSKKHSTLIPIQKNTRMFYNKKKAFKTYHSTTFIYSILYIVDRYFS